jgi:hypothetical protein
VSPKETWEALPERNREMNRRVGERLFSMGHRAGRLSMKAERETARHERDAARREAETLQRELDTSSLEAADWARRSRQAEQRAHAEMTRAQNVEARLAEVTFPRLFPVKPGPLAELAGRIEGVMVQAFAEPGDGERRGPAAARRVLRLMDEHLRGAASATEAPAQGPTLEALRELVATWSAAVFSSVSATRAAGFRACIADLCRVAGIEPPPCPPSPPADTTPRRARVAPEGRVTWWGFGRRWYGTATGGVTGDGYAIVDPDDSEGWGSRLVILSHVHRVGDAAPVDDGDHIADPQGTPGPVAQDGSAGDQMPADDRSPPRNRVETIMCAWADRLAACGLVELAERVRAEVTDPDEKPIDVVAAREIIERTGETPEAATSILAAPSPQGPRIEPEAPGYDPGCGANSGVRGRSFVCTAHFQGEHLATGLDGRVCRRWPIAPVSPETPDPRWEPGAVWETYGERYTIGKVLPSARPTHARFIGLLSDVEFARMTEVNGWRYVGE